MWTMRMAAVALPGLLALASCAQRPAETRKETSMPQSQDDRAQVAQLALDVKPLQPFFHAEDAPDRKPLLILKNDQAPDQPRLTKFGQPVRYVTRAEAGGKPYLEFTLLKIEGDTATVEFSYPVEGVVGRVSLTKSAGAWKVESQSIRER